MERPQNQREYLSPSNQKSTNHPRRKFMLMLARVWCRKKGKAKESRSFVEVLCWVMILKLLREPCRGFARGSAMFAHAVTTKQKAETLRPQFQAVYQPADFPESPILSSPALFGVRPECSGSSAAAINRELQRRTRVVEGKKVKAWENEEMQNCTWRREVCTSNV